MENKYIEELIELKEIYKRSLDSLEDEMCVAIHRMAKQMKSFICCYDKVEEFKEKNEILLTKMENDGEEDYDVDFDQYCY